MLDTLSPVNKLRGLALLNMLLDRLDMMMRAKRAVASKRKRKRKLTSLTAKPLVRRDCLLTSMTRDIPTWVLL